MRFHESLTQKVFINRTGLSSQLQKLGESKSVFTNGCFDLVHRGHIDYLSRARDLGELLIVGLNSDASVHRLKGGIRPIVPWEDRATVLAGLSCVDYIIKFEEDTPIETLSILRPSIHVKGGDYKVEDLPERSIVEGYGGKIVILPFLEGRSTSNLIEKIR